MGVAAFGFHRVGLSFFKTQTKCLHWKTDTYSYITADLFETWNRDQRLLWVRQISQTVKILD